MKKQFFCLLFSASLLYSCKKETGPQGVAGPSLTGSLSGFVYLTDQYQQKVYPMGSTKVKIGGINDSTMTDSTGKYTFSSLSTGTYEIDYTHTGYGAFKRAGQQFLGGGSLLAGDVRLGAIPTFTIIKDSVYTTKKDTTSIVVKTVLGNADSSRTRSLVYFVGKVSNVSADPATYSVTFTSTLAVNTNTQAYSIPDATLYRAGFEPGKTIYIRTYPTSLGTTYEDPGTGQTVYTSVGTAGTTLSVTLP